MTTSPSVEKLKDARDKMAEAYEMEVQDNMLDNGNLDLIHKAIGIVEDAIHKITARNPE